MQALRYKDFHIVARPAPILSSQGILASQHQLGSVEIIHTVKELGQMMDEAGLLEWWRNAMGFPTQNSN